MIGFSESKDDTVTSPEQIKLGVDIFGMKIDPVTHVSSPFWIGNDKLRSFCVYFLLKMVQ